MMNLDVFNKLPNDKAILELTKCCVSSEWVKKIAQDRPYRTADQLVDRAASVWYRECTAEDYLEAFRGHPKIGDIQSLKATYSNTKAWAEIEQSKVNIADLHILNLLAEINIAYENRFGYIFIVSAKGKTADEILAIIERRIEHSPEDELKVAMNEQHKITLIRLAKLIDNLVEEADISSQISTHALDTSTGNPAKGMPIILKVFDGESYKPLCVGITNSDGRISDLLPAGKKLELGSYQMYFDTETYHKENNQKVFFPKIYIHFIVSNDEHYHIPLLLSTYGYSTYKGS